jgi:DMSO/TMAO reductase YedYZ heme-binding membrane subunit
MFWIKSLFNNIRFYVLAGSIVFSLFVYLYIITVIPLEQLQIIRLTQVYALSSLAFLYLALLAGPFCYTFKRFAYRGPYLKARRAIGVSAFYFALLHSSFAFFGQLGGFEGLGFLSNKYLLAISLSFTALIILFLMAATSFDFIIAKITFPRWKMLHRLVYLAGIFILIHALMLGTHFEDLFGFVPQLVFVGLMFLLTLEALRIDTWARERFESYPNFGYASVVILGVVLTALLYFFLPIQGEKGLTFGIHSQHIQLAKEAQGGATGTSSQDTSGLPKIPGLQGDRTKRFTVDFNFPENIQSGEDTTITFKVYDASSGSQIKLFNKIYSKVVHFIVVDSSLTYFNHIHPDYKDGEFSITTKFPNEGQYRVYADFQPFGAIEQRIAGTINVGEVGKPELSRAKPDTNLSKTFGDYTVALKYPRPLKSNQISIGQQLLSFTITDAKKRPVTNLKPYLEAYGHMVMINQKTYDYIHVHPNDFRVPKPDQNGGPTVEFMPLGLYGPIKPGVYRVFTQFNPDNNLFTSDFTVKIE